jgi:hypothetical protein
MQSIVLNINDDSKVSSLLSFLRGLQDVDIKTSGIEKRKKSDAFFSKPVHPGNLQIYPRDELHER